MIDKMELSLDDIIAQTRGRRGGGGGVGGQRRGGGRFPRKPSNLSPRSKPIQRRKAGGYGGGAALRYTKGDPDSEWKHDLFEGRRRRPGFGSTKLLISNLDFGVSGDDIRELFLEFGPLKSHSVHYDRSGRSLGTADVVYERREDAMKAMKTYNNVPLDGRPMHIEVATSELPEIQPRRSFGSSMGSRLQMGGGGGRQGGSRAGGSVGRRAGPRSGGSGGRQTRDTLTAEELDAELEAYTKSMKI